MILDEFKQHADIWGPDIARWPAPLQPEAQALSGTPKGRDVLADAAAFDAVLRSVAPEVEGRRADDAVFHVLARIAGAGDARHGPIGEGLLRWLMPIGSMAVSAALGVAAAHMTQPATANHGGVVLVSQFLDSGSFAADLDVR
jgi:hypothetical protein